MTHPRNPQPPKDASETPARGKGQPGGAGYAAGHRAFGAGLTMAVSVTGFAYLGIWLDERWETKPWLTLSLVLFALAGGFLHLLRAVAPEMLPKKKTARPSTEDSNPRDRASRRP